MSTSDIAWGAILSAGLAYEVVALVNKKQDDTLSETTRRWFGTRTPVGRWAFGVTWVGFATWYFFHILW
jgi:hypothetical protein